GYQQSGYQQNSYVQPGGFSSVPVQQEKDRPMTTGDWLVTMLLMMIPVANFVLLLVWAFSSDTNTNKKNWARAELILMLIAVGITVLFTVAVVGSLASVFASL
ncbi:MAG: hypothetical protein Q4B22_10410, partial [Eubacteriales bacterium]|nr:hypothetical protein [Eubacteriales bacterium]